MPVAAPAPPSPDQRPPQEWHVRIPEPTNFRITPLANQVIITEGPDPTRNLSDDRFLPEDAVHVAAVPPESVAPYTSAPLPEGFDKHARPSVFEMPANPTETIYPHLARPRHLSTSTRSFRAGIARVRQFRGRPYQPRHIKPEDLN